MFSIGFGSRYLNALRRLRQQRPILTQLYDAAGIAEREISAAAKNLTATTAEWSSVGNVNISPAVQQIEAIETYQAARDIYAASVALVLDDILGNLFDEFRLAGGVGDPGPVIAEHSIRAILRALGNNFRHYDEWRRDEAKPTGQQIASIRPIAAVLGVDLEAACREICKSRGEQEIPFAHHPYDHIMARFVLHEIGKDTYAPIEALVKASMDAMVTALGLDDDAMVEWGRQEWA
jgi:hypothetical protein